MRTAASAPTGNSSVILELTDAVWGYERPVAGPLSLGLSRGERLGLTGANGTGKSTLLRAIQGEAKLHAGKLELFARVTAYQPQIPVRLEQMPWSAREHLEIMEATSTGLPGTLQSFMTQRADRLSGGQFQLLSLWSALKGEADLVLLDEPTSYLDPAHVEVLEDILGTLNDSTSVLVVSHDEDFLTRTCSRSIELSGSKSLVS